jgi:hypothetical protein
MRQNIQTVDTLFGGRNSASIVKKLFPCQSVKARKVMLSVKVGDVVRFRYVRSNSNQERIAKVVGIKPTDALKPDTLRRRRMYRDDVLLTVVQDDGQVRNVYPTYMVGVQKYGIISRIGLFLVGVRFKSRGQKV